jgi:hypothetical protein
VRSPQVGLADEQGDKGPVTGGCHARICGGRRVKLPPAARTLRRARAGQSWVGSRQLYLFPPPLRSCFGGKYQLPGHGCAPPAVSGAQPLRVHDAVAASAGIETRGLRNRDAQSPDDVLYSVFPLLKALCKITPSCRLASVELGSAYAVAAPLRAGFG